MPALDAEAIGFVLDGMLRAGYVDEILDFARRELGKASFEQARRELNGGKKQFAEFLVATLKAAEATDAGVPGPGPAKILPPRRPAHKAAAAADETDLFDD
jgi:hypothetical protein